MSRPGPTGPDARADEPAPTSADGPAAQRTDGSAGRPPAPSPRSNPSAASVPPAGGRRRRRQHDGPDRRGRRTGLAALGLVVVALLVWFAWPLLSSDDRGGAGDTGDAAAEEDGDGGSALDEQQRALLDTVGAFEPADCRSPTREPMAGEQVSVACTSADRAPTRVVFRRFGSTTERDSALAALAGGAGEGDCRDDRRASHDYTGSAGTGRVVCATDDRTAGLSWSVPDEPVMGSARLDDPNRADDLYEWWADLVERSDA